MHDLETTPITPAYVALMARYHHWQNDSVIAAAEKLTPEQRIEDRGAFFGSLLGTLSHILWGDEAWLSRFDVVAPPRVKISESARAYPDWAAYVAARRAIDEKIAAWAEGLQPSDIAGDFEWYSMSMQKEMTTPKAVAVMQIFNHGTHHRGQVHTLLMEMGVDPGVTDLPFMPGFAS
ncbi:MAG: DinB family protein [Pseudomonadota bacterium]